MSKKLKVLIASETYPIKSHYDGAAVFTERLAKGLAARGHQVLAIGPNSEFKDNFSSDGSNLRVFRLKSFLVKPIHPRFRFIYNINLYQKIAKAVKTFRPNIIHIQNHLLLGRILLDISRKTNTPIGGTNHFMPENLIQWMPFGKWEASRIMWMDFKRVYRVLDFVTTPTEAAARLLDKIGLNREVIVVSNGIDLKNFKKTSLNKNFLQEYKINDKLPIFLFVGRIDVDKNIDLIIKAAAIVLRKKKVQVVIVGVGKKEESYKNLANNLGISEYVLFTGKLSNDELAEMLSAAQIYIASGEAELQGIAVMEAMAFGLPVLGLNAVAIPELVKDGVNGYLFEKNAKDLAEKMLKILKNKDKMKKMSKNSLKIIKEHDFDKTLEKFEELYRKIIEKHNKNN